jgi:hypothetical protein
VNRIVAAIASSTIAGVGIYHCWRRFSLAAIGQRGIGFDALLFVYKGASVGLALAVMGLRGTMSHGLRLFLLLALLGNLVVLTAWIILQCTGRLVA